VGNPSENRNLTLRQKPYTAAVRGVISYGAYIPYHRLDRAEIAGLLGGSPGKGQRAVASYDEDTTSMGVEAARFALRTAPPTASPEALWFATSEPAYLDKTNATTLHAALRLDGSCAAMDMGGAIRSGLGALKVACESRPTTLVISSDVRTGLAGGSDEAGGGDAAAAFLIGDDRAGPVIAEFLGAASATDEFTERWRQPGDRRSRTWEERFGEVMYGPVGEEAWNAGLKAAELTAEQVDRVVVAGFHARAAGRVAAKVSGGREVLVDSLAATVGNPATAQAGLLLASALDGLAPGQVVGVLGLADGADVLFFRATDAIASFTPARPVATQVANGGRVPYGKFLSWRGMLQVEPPNRPEPFRPSSSASHRKEPWKFGFVGTRDRETGTVHLPPSRVAIRTGTLDTMEPAPMADVPATIVTYTVDRLIYSPSPPVVFAVVDFDGGGRLPCELTDVDPSQVAIGDRVEMTFRRLFTAGGISNYFWKARPIRG
jgi:3-hydroxy-3-methylglutaryl CoA synthase/uncharacterized OB-fold protein